MTEDLGSRLARIRQRRTQRTPNDRWMLVLGGTLLPLGLAAVLLGWAGVTHTVYLYDQLTYLASGSVLGLALVIVGGFVYFTYWQTVQVREARVRHDESQSVLLRIEALLAQGERALSGLVATPKGNQVHRPSCTAVVGRTDLRSVPATTDLAPCRLCDPLAATA
jgi:hypothetical protein